jgi:hypothetical protein
MKLIDYELRSAAHLENESATPQPKQHKCTIFTQRIACIRHLGGVGAKSS